MKKTKLLMALLLASFFGNAQNMLTNGGFETYSTLPTTCPTLPSSNASTLSDVNNWSETVKTYRWDPGMGCVVSGTCTNTAVYGRSYYYNSTTGGNGSCEPIAANSGTGYVVLQSHGVFVTDPNACHNGADQYIYQSLSGTTLYASNNYTFQGYVYLGSGFGCSYLTADLTTGTTMTSGTSISVTGSGWVAFSVTLTVPSNGSSYNLVLGPTASNYCIPSPTYFYYAFDDLSLSQAPCVANAGSNKNNTTGCCTTCPGIGVQVGTAALSGLTYAWTCSAANCYISNASVAQPTVSPCYTTTPTTYSVTVSGPGCNTAISTMQVTTSTYGGANCCRIANPNHPEKNILFGTNFGVFPNPANSEVTITLTKIVDYIRIIDISGKIMFETKNITDSHIIVDISKYAKGVYFVVAKTGEEVEKQKLIVE
ncbi:MAG TPA: T9SS type A sorting domain-containing protein [Bacteroidia bacterium]|jgi:hypothetical protein|nr:T9SS type A sorting domain-containing protein [Bacteroidia bacterium]